MEINIPLSPEKNKKNKPQEIPSIDEPTPSTENDFDDDELNLDEGILNYGQ